MNDARPLAIAVLVVGLAVAAQPAHSGQAGGVGMPPSIRTVAAVLHGGISGMVSDERGEPLSGATISVLGVTATLSVTGGDGRFDLRGLPPGPYVVRAHMPGFTAASRALVEVRPNAQTFYSAALRRAVSRPADGEPLAARPVLAAGMASVPAAPSFSPPGERRVADNGAVDGPDPADHDDGELTWRLRHLRRSVLKDADSAAVAEAGEPAEALPIPGGASFFSRAMESSARFAAALFTDFPFDGELNLFTIGSFEGPRDLFSPRDAPRGVAYLSIGSSQGRDADWSVQGAMTQGDVASWILAGSFVKRAPAAHAYEVGMSYSTQRYDGGNPLALAAVTDGSRNVGSVYAVDRWTVSRWLALSYGASYARYDYLAGRGLLSPRVSVTLTPRKAVRIAAAASHHALAPGAEEFLPPLKSGPWVPPERTFAPLVSQDGLDAERARHYEVSLERDFARSYTVGIRGFRQTVEDQLVTLFGVRPREGLASDLGHYHVARAGDVRTAGWSVSLSRPLPGRLRGSVDYTTTMARWAPAPERAIISRWAPSAVRPATETLHDVTTTVEAEIPQTATRVFALYRINTNFAGEAIDEDAPRLGMRFDVRVNQALPFLDFTSAEWEVLFAIRSLFREPLNGTSVYDELLVVRPPKRIVGGLLVRF